MNEQQLLTIVTGASSGIGEAVARLMAQQTAVLLVARRQAELEAICAEIRRAGGTAEFVAGDVTKKKCRDNCLKLVRERHYRVRNLVLSAGIGYGGAITALSTTRRHEMFEVNVHAAAAFIKTFVPEMIQNGGGNICPISSIAGLTGLKYNSAYAETKAALIAMALSMADEYARKGIVTVPICPGFVDTPMTQSTIATLMRTRSIDETKARELVAGNSQQKRIIPASEVATMVEFVCSGKCPSLNGHPIIMTGGAREAHS